MRTFKILNGDLVFDGENNLAMVEGNEEIAQAIERILTTNKNEWFLNLDHGLDYQAIQGKGKDNESIKLTITEAILQEDRIEEVENIEIELDRSRHIRIKIKAKIRTGETLDISEVIELG